MRIRKVQDLRAYMEAKGLSPEAFARELKVSNMTVRRLLDKPPSTPIPERYHSQLDLHSGAGNAMALMPHISLDEVTSLKPFLEELEKSGTEHADLGQVRKEVKVKLAGDRSSRLCQAFVLSLVRIAGSSTVSFAIRSLALGALIYFVNPFDFIPDAMIGIGYLDDFAVLSVVSDIIFEHQIHHV